MDEIDPEIQVYPYNNYMMPIEKADPQILRQLDNMEGDQKNDGQKDRVIAVLYALEPSEVEKENGNTENETQTLSENTNPYLDTDNIISEMIQMAGGTFPVKDTTILKLSEMMLQKVNEWCLLTKADRILNGKKSQSHEMVTRQSLKRIYYLGMDTCRILAEKWHMYDAALVLFKGFEEALSDTSVVIRDQKSDPKPFADYEAMLHIQYLVLQKTGLIYAGSPYGRWAYKAMDLLHISPEYTINTPPYVAEVNSVLFWGSKPVTESMKDELYIKTRKYYEKRDKLMEEYERLNSPARERPWR